MVIATSHEMEIPVTRSNFQDYTRCLQGVKDSELSLHAARQPLIIILLMNGGAAFTLIVMVRIVMIRKVFIGLSLLFLSVSFASAASKPNLVLITLDSTRVDRMGFLGAKGASTPNLDRLASESLVFDHAYAQSPGAVVSHATILSGA